jgi:hypothetical protein
VGITWHARRRGIWGGNKKTSSCGSVSGAPCETAAGDGAYRWVWGAYEVVVMVGSCVHETRGGERVWTKNVKPSHHGSALGASCETAMQDSAGWCVGVAWWRVRGGGVACS